MIKLFKPFIPPTVDEPLLETLHSGMITQGEKVEEFEGKLKEAIHNRWVLSLNSGTAALHLALRLADVGPGDEVISTPMTCIATNVPIAWERARIVWADVDPVTGLIDPDDIERKITKKTKAVVTVDWSGMPVDYDRISQICHGSRSLWFISDAAHSLGAEYRGLPVGNATLADMTAFSFQAIKTITAVDGGALSFAGPRQYDRGKKLRWFGVDRENKVQFRGQIDVPEVGLKMHMNDVNATIGIESLKFLSANVRMQRVNAGMYINNLHPYYFTSPYWNKDGTKSACWLMVVLLPNTTERAEFVEYMRREGVEVSQVHWRNDKHSAFVDFLPEESLPGLDTYSDRMICIPVHNQLNRRDVNEVIEIMNDFPIQ